MRIDWKAKSPVSEVVTFLQDLLGTNDQGNITLGFGGAFDVYVGILQDSLSGPSDVPERKLRDLTRRALIDAKKAEDLSETRILAEIRAAVKKYLQTTPSRFVLLGSLSIKNTLPFPRARLDGATITFLPHRPKQFSIPGYGYASEDSTPNGYTYVKVHLQAREAHDAADSAFDSLDFLRGLWNWHQTYNQWRITFGPAGSKPVNPIMLGPLFTLHHPDGSLALEHEWWHTSGPHGDPFVPRDMSRLKTSERQFRARIQNSSFPEQLRELLIRYSRSLDDDLRASYVNLWSFLETITGTGASSYDVTIRRAAFVFKDARRAHATLSYLRSWRNKIVHEGRHTDDMETLLYELKHFVDYLLGVLLIRSAHFGSLSEFYEFLDLPVSPTTLKRRERIYRYGRQFRES